MPSKHSAGGSGVAVGRVSSDHLRVIRTGGTCAVEIALFAATVAQAAGVPFAIVVKEAIREVNQFWEDYKFVADQAGSLPKSIQQCSDIVQNDMFPAVWREMDKNPQTTIKPAFCQVASDFVQIVYEIKEICEKWNKKNQVKKMWNTNAYKEKFMQLSKQLDRFKMDVLMAFVAKMHSSTHERMNVIQGTADEILAEVKVTTRDLMNVLQGTVDEILAETKLTNEFLAKVNLTTRDQPPNSLLPESPFLYGREAEIEKLGKALNAGGRMAALVGGAGMGKSHCASEFAHKWLQQDVAHRFVLWLESDTENIIRDSYLNALDKFPGGHDLDLKEEIAVRDIAGLLWEKLREVPTQFEWMAVYNNVPEALGDLEGHEAFSPLFFPTPLQDWGRGRILLTTRCTSYGGRVKSLGNHHVSKILVEPIDETTAVTMLMNNLDDASVTDSERDAAKETVKLFGYLPLAIVTANSQMVDATLTVSEYLENMNAGLDGGVHDAVSLALKKALAYAHKQDLGRALEVAAFLSPDNLTLELLGCDRRTARRLCELSLLRHAGNDVYTIHRLHQEAARNGLSPLKAIRVVNDALKSFNANNSDTWKFGISMIPHLESLEKHVDIMITNGAIDLENDGYCEYAWIFDSYAKILHIVLHDYEDARSHYEKAIQKLKLLFGPEAKNADLASLLDNLGNLECELGNYDKARKYYGQSLKMKQHVYGPEAKNTYLATTLGNLGILERNLGNYDKARSYYEQSLEMKQHVYGPKAKNTELATILRNLGELEMELGNYDKARVYYDQSLEMQRHVYGPEAKNTDLATTLGNLGILEMELGYYDKARLYYEQSLEMKRHVYGPEAKNTDLATTLGNLGILERKLGNYDKARLYFEQSLEMQQHVNGFEAKNTDLASTLGNLGILERKLGYYDKTRLYYEQSLEMKRHVYGPEAKNTDLATTLGNLGILERKLGNYDKARSYYEQSLEMKQHVYGPKAKNTELATTLSNLGSLEMKLGNYDEARLYYEQSLEMKQHVYGPEAKNPDLASTLGSLGNIEKDLGNYDKARFYYEQSLVMKRLYYGSKHPDLASTLGNLGRLEMKLGNYDEARLYFEQSLEIEQDVLGPEAKNTDLATTLGNLGILERKLGNFDKARSYYEQSLEMKQHVYGSEAKNTDLDTTLGNLGILEMELGNYDKARLYYEQSLEMKRHMYGPEAKNTDLASTLGNLGNLESHIGNYDKARVYYEQSLEMQQHVYGPEAKNTELAKTLGNLGNLEMMLGNYDEARLYFEQSLEMERHVYVPEAKNTSLASTLANLGLLEKMIGNYDKAREKLEEALAMAIDSLGEAASMHPLVEKIRKNLEACNV